MALGRQVRSGHVFSWDRYVLARFLQPTAMNATKNPVHPVPLDEGTNHSECRRARDAKRDIPVPLSPCARATTCTCRGRPAPGPRLRHFAPPPDPYDEWLDGVSDALASGLRQLRDLRPLRHFGQPLAPTPTADYPPRASRFPGGQRRNCSTFQLVLAPCSMECQKAGPRRGGDNRVVPFVNLLIYENILGFGRQD